MIGGDGNVYEGAGWHKEGAHSQLYNNQSIAIALITHSSRKYIFNPLPFCSMITLHPANCLR